MKTSEATRRGLLQTSAMLASAAAFLSSGAALGKPGPEATAARSARDLLPLTPPASGFIPVAFPVSDSTVLIDMAGPWEVFGNASMIASDGTMDMSGKNGFNTYTVAEKSQPIVASGGMKITPDYTFETAPAPKLIVIPAQGGASDAMLRWIRQSSKAADVTMSVCTGAYVLAQTGLLSGKSATTHHGAYADLAMRYPDIHVRRGYRFVDEGSVASSGGLTCGVDLAFHVVERYYGRTKVEQTALNMEYQGRGWMDSSGADNAIYAKRPTGLACPICSMPVSTKTSLTEDFKGHSYYFCSPNCKAAFDRSPDMVLRFLASG